ncbi:Histidine phosphatase superfamily,P-loop containing nucleoside triphosphate hydrolase,6- [Cinara cedri]|uniref:Histidine phosphatase superfamily,P-loop containing nucleoside triphosphate hydrolase,6 n=1 Tax=Cinara cedri TaxID=506608 RepID=A0A5E4N8P4_9HEMI|nr:Histidine phosphatase superfamily,P-loop containing nucleoside triphosphate hydrolase,6- [Cinara cedri]
MAFTGLRLSTKKDWQRQSQSESEDDDMVGRKDLMPIVMSQVGNHFVPLVITMVGLPARGKTVLADKIQQYLNWTNHKAKVFCVSSYRRKHIESYSSHDLFRKENSEAAEIRQLSAQEAQDDATKWLQDGGDVAILDGTHITQARRQAVYDHFYKIMGYKVLFIECVCDDEMLLEHNVKEVLQFSKDYRNMSSEKALDDFHHKIEHYMEQHEPMKPKTDGYSYIKYLNGGESLTVCRLNYPMQSEVLAFVSNFKPLSKTFYFSRHGESENNVLGRIGGDADLSVRGRTYAAALARYFNSDDRLEDLRVWTSELKRTHQTAQGIKAPIEHVPALNELYAGVCEGLSYEEMQCKFPQEFAWRDQDKLQYRYPWGESYIDIMTRLKPVLLQLEGEIDNLLIISHQAVLRCLLGYFLNKKHEELPYINVPLHIIIKLTINGYKCKMEVIKLNIECVDTYRIQPKNCSINRSADDALLTVPAHFENLTLWNHPPIVQL